MFAFLSVGKRKGGEKNTDAGKITTIFSLKKNKMKMDKSNLLGVERYHIVFLSLFSHTHVMVNVMVPDACCLHHQKC